MPRTLSRGRKIAFSLILGVAVLLVVEGLAQLTYRAIYLLTQGAEFYLILNLDGFNEMTLAMLEGKSKGLHPAYPRGWDVMLGNRLTGRKLRKIAQLLKVREEQSSLIAAAQSTPLARPALVGLLLAHKVVFSNHRRGAAASFLRSRTSPPGKTNRSQPDILKGEGGLNRCISSAQLLGFSPT